MEFFFDREGDFFDFGGKQTGLDFRLLRGSIKRVVHEQITVLFPLFGPFELNKQDLFVKRSRRCKTNQA